MKHESMIGKRYGRLTVVSEYKLPNWVYVCHCKCDCGNEIDVRSGNLRTGHTKSCGCFYREIMGHSSRTHGMTNTRIYRIYRKMLDRCYRTEISNYSDYGGRGIRVCDEWKNDFVAFMEWAYSHGYRDDLTIERINNDGNYEPSNCRWTDKYTQANNRRSSRYIKINGEIGTVAQMARKYDLDYGTILEYSHGKRPKKYNYMDIEVVDETELQANLR